MSLLSVFLLAVTTCTVVAATGGSASATPQPAGGPTTTIAVNPPAVLGGDLLDPGTPTDGPLVSITFEHGSW